MSSAGVESETALAVGRVVAALRDGYVAVIPTETVYGLAGLASGPAGHTGAVDRIRSMTQDSSSAARPLAWHAQSPERVIEELGLVGSQRRLVERLAPGPITFLIERDPAQLERARKQLGVASGVIDNDSEIVVRVPEHALAREIIERVGGIVVAQSVAAAAMGSGETAPVAEAESAGVAAVLDDGRTRYGKPSTVVRLGKDARWNVVSVGAMETRIVERKAKCVVLFVCTGNTCRSPMSEAIARHLLAERSEGDLTIADSAGTDAGGGWPMSPEAVIALRAMGIEPADHRSKRLTREVAGRADVIFALTPSHLQSLLAIDPTASDRAHTLDPTGAGVIDPIGQSQSFYDETAAQIRSLIEGRLTEILG